MNRSERSAFNAIFYKELRDTYFYPIVVAGSFVTISLFAHSLRPLGIAAITGDVAKFSAQFNDLILYYGEIWGTIAATSLFVTAALLTPCAFVRERTAAKIGCLRRFPVSLQTVFIAKFSAIATLCGLLAAAFVLLGFCFDFYVDATPFSALSTVGRPDSTIRAASFFLASFEVFCWGAFWSTRARREASAVAISVASTFAVWAFAGAVAILVEPSIRATAPTSALRNPFACAAVGGGVSFETLGFAALRFGLLAVPLIGVVRQFQRGGVKTLIGNGINVDRRLNFRQLLLQATFSRFSKKNDVASPAKAFATVSNDLASSSNSDAFADAATVDQRSTCRSEEASRKNRTSRRLAVLCRATLAEASLFGRFPGAVALDLLVLNYLFFNFLGLGRAGEFLPFLFLFVSFFGTRAFAGLRQNRLILTTRLPVSPALYFVSQIIVYGGLYAVGLLLPLSFELLAPDAAERLRDVIAAPEGIDKSSGDWPLTASAFVVLTCASVFWGASVARSKSGAWALGFVFFSLAVTIIPNAIGPLLPKLSVKFFHVCYAPFLVVVLLVASYFSTSNRFKNSE